MPTGFNEYEKQEITNSLIEHGKILFSELGFQKTSINEITKKVGIAPGTFYKFYNSKEELYFEILEREEDQLRKQFLSVDISKENEPKQVVKHLLLHIVSTIETNALIRQFYFENNIEFLLRKLPLEKREEHFNNDTAAFIPLIERWQKEGLILKKSPEVISGVFRSLFVLTLHKKDIGESVYRQTIDFFIDLVVDGLFNEEDV